MGRSLIGGLIANGHKPESIRGGEPDLEKAKFIENEFKIKVYGENKDAIKGADVVILAVKPNNILQTLTEIGDQIKQEGLLVITIAAGVRIHSLETVLGEDQPIVRVMPNTPALIQAGASSLYANKSVSEEHRELAEEIMRSVGLALWLDDEQLMDTVTALSGSGPAYFFLVMEVMEKAAVKLGLPQKQARLLTLETALGAAKMALESNVDVGTLRHHVTSPGGTTEQALKVLMDQGNIEQLFMDALRAAQIRSRELADSIESTI